MRKFVLPLGAAFGVISAWFIPSSWPIWKVALLIAAEALVVWLLYKKLDANEKDAD